MQTHASTSIFFKHFWMNACLRTFAEKACHLNSFWHLTHLCKSAPPLHSPHVTPLRRASLSCWEFHSDVSTSLQHSGACLQIRRWYKSLYFIALSFQVQKQHVLWLPPLSHSWHVNSSTVLLSRQAVHLFRLFVSACASRCAVLAGNVFCWLRSFTWAWHIFRKLFFRKASILKRAAGNTSLHVIQ